MGEPLVTQPQNQQAIAPKIPQWGFVLDSNLSTVMPAQTGIIGKNILASVAMPLTVDMCLSQDMKIGEVSHLELLKMLETCRKPWMASTC